MIELDYSLSAFGELWHAWLICAGLLLLVWVLSRAMGYPRD